MKLIDDATLRGFEEELDAAHPERGADRFRILAYGEISTVVELAGRDDVVLKRMSGFANADEVASYLRVVEDYVAELRARGVRVVETQMVPVTTARNGRVVHLVQSRLVAETIGHRVLQRVTEAELRDLLLPVYRTLHHVYRLNDEAASLPEGVTIALDAQLSNWAFEPRAPAEAGLVYFDVGTPLLRRGGVDQLDGAALARSMPRPLGWVFLRFVVPSVVQRYFELRQAITDVLANFVKEAREDLLGSAVELTNEWSRDEAGGAVGPFAVEGIRRYYDVDVRIWEFLGLSRRLARFVDTRILGRPYPFLIPGKVERRPTRSGRART